MKKFIKTYSKPNEKPVKKIEIDDFEKIGFFIKKYHRYIQDKISSNYSSSQSLFDLNTQIDSDAFIIENILKGRLVFSREASESLRETLERTVSFLYEENDGDLDVKKVKVPMVAKEIEELLNEKDWDFITIDFLEEESLNDLLFHNEDIFGKKRLRFIYSKEKNLFLEENFFEEKDIFFYLNFNKLKENINEFKKLESHASKMEKFKSVLTQKDKSKAVLRNTSGKFLRQKTFSKFSEPVVKEVQKYKDKINKEIKKIIEYNQKQFPFYPVENFKSLISLFNKFSVAHDEITKLSEEKKELNDFLFDDKNISFELRVMEGLGEEEHTDENYLDIAKIEKDVEGFSENFKKEALKYKEELEKNLNSNVYKIINKYLKS